MWQKALPWQIREVEIGPRVRGYEGRRLGAGVGRLVGVLEVGR